MRLTPTWDFEAYRADVMQNRGSHYRSQSAASQRHEGVTGPMKSRCAARNGDDQRGIPHSLSDRDVTGEIPRK
eukprot:5946208-Amphidinium_carterae.1